MNQKELSNWLKILIIVSSILGLIICFTLAPRIGTSILANHPHKKYMFWPCLIFIWVGSVPIYLAFFQAWKIFDNVGKDKAFSEQSVSAFNIITKLCIVEIILFCFGLVSLIFLNVSNITVYIVVFFIMFSAIFVGTSSAIFSHLVSKAVALQKENDLTI